MKKLILALFLIPLLSACEDPYQRQRQIQTDYQHRLRQNKIDDQEKYRACLESHIPSSFLSPDGTRWLTSPELFRLADEAIQSCNGFIIMLESDAYNDVYGSGAMSSHYQNDLQRQIGLDMYDEQGRHAAQRDHEQWIGWGRVYFVETSLARMKEQKQNQ